MIKKMKAKHKKMPLSRLVGEQAEGGGIGVRPLGDRVLVEPLATNENGITKSGIIIPETVSKERPEQGVIVAVGPGRMTDQGKLIPLKVKPAQKIIFSKYGPDEIKIKDKEYFIISESNILAIIE